jgi:lipoprotein-anchoring transpeptidase ErfK/SrfK
MPMVSRTQLRKVTLGLALWGTVSATMTLVAVAVAVVVAVAVAPARAAKGGGETGSPGSLRATVSLQIALERAGFSPGIIDGIPGGKTTTALREFQRSRGMPVTGALDRASRMALAVDDEEAFVRYTITAADRAAVGPVPKAWVEKSQLDRLAYPSLAEEIAEKFHCSQGLLAKLNPQRSLSALSVGGTVVVPNVDADPPVARAARLEVDLANKIIRAFSPRGDVVGMFYCSLAAKREKLPSGQAEVVAIAVNPTYTFDPEMWPEVKGVDTKLTIPPGPRNPVGVRWIGLSLPGVGMHGTPNPELIGKTGSHGCIRLTNWDAVRLSRMVTEGTPVKFASSGARFAEAAR